MTVFELHIEVAQKLQEQGAYQRDRLFPEAIDLALNQGQEQIIKENIDINFSDREAKIKNIENLIEKNKIISTIVPTATEAIVDPNMVYAFLPSNSLYIINKRVKLVKSTICTTLNPSTSTIVKYGTAITIPTANVQSGYYYPGSKIITSGTVTIYSSPTTFATALVSVDQKYEVLNDIVHTINSVSNFAAFGYQAFPSNNGLILVGTTSTSSITLNVYTTSGKTVVDVSNTGTTSALSYTTYSSSAVAALDNVETVIVPVREVPGDVIYNNTSLNSFTKPTTREILATRTTNSQFFNPAIRFNIYYPVNSIITDLIIDYVRKPTPISLTFGRTSELDPSIHRDVVDRAVEILKKNIQDPSMRSDTQYNNLRTRT